MEAIRVGLVGCGRWGENLARNLAAIESFRLKAVCDVEESRARAVGDRWEVPFRHDGVDALLGGGSIDALVIATPAHTHAGIARAALDAGLHVLVEKPLAMSGRQARDLADRAARGGLTLMADHTELHSGAVREVVARLDAGEVGDPISAVLIHANVGDGPQDADVLWDLAPHDLAILDRLFGDEPERLAVSAGRTGPARAVRIALDYPRGVVAEVVLERGAPARRRSLALHGTAATIECSDLGAGAIVRLRRTASGNGGDGAEFEIHCDPTEPLRTLCREFAERVRGGDGFDDAERAVRVVRTIEAARAAVAAQRPLRPHLADQ